MILRPHDHHRPSRTSDGEGGFTESLGAANTLYGAIELYEDKPTMIVRREADVKIGDVIVALAKDI